MAKVSSPGSEPGILAAVINKAQSSSPTQSGNWAFFHSHWCLWIQVSWAWHHLAHAARDLCWAQQRPEGTGPNLRARMQITFSSPSQTPGAPLIRSGAHRHRPTNPQLSSVPGFQLSPPSSPGVSFYNDHEESTKPPLGSADITLLPESAELATPVSVHRFADLTVTLPFQGLLILHCAAVPLKGVS